MKKIFFALIFLLIFFSFCSADSPKGALKTEIVSERTLVQKAFDLGNGQVEYDVYSAPIHYKSGDNFLDINSDVVPTVAKGYNLSVAGAPYKVFWKTDVSSVNGFRFEVGDYWLSFDLSSGSLDLKEQAGNPATGTTVSTIASSVAKTASNKVNFLSAFSNVDLNYELGYVGVKENFILKAKPPNLANYLYLSVSGKMSFDKNLSIWADDVKQSGKDFKTSNEIFFKDKDNNVVMYFPKPIATDAKGNSVALIYEATAAGDFSLKVPFDFLKTAIFPVYIDPTVNYYSGAGDGYVEDSNYGYDYNGQAFVRVATTNIRAGSYSDYTSQSFKAMIYYFTYSPPIPPNPYDYAFIDRVFLPFDTSGIPDNATISSATLNLYGYKYYQTGSSYDWLYVVQTTQASPTSLSVNDYNAVGVGTGGDFNVMKWTDYSYNAISLTALNWIIKTGYTKIGLRYGYDMYTSKPAGSYAIPQVNFNSSEATTGQPYLQVIASGGLDANIWQVDGNDLNASMPVFTYQKDGNLTVRWWAYSSTQKDLNANLFYGTSSMSKANKLFGDFNMSLANGCDSNNSKTGIVCSQDWNISGQVLDANYWLTLEINDGNISNAIIVPAPKSFRVDTNAPINSSVSVSSYTGQGKYTYANPQTLTTTSAGASGMYFSCDGVTYGSKINYATTYSLFNVKTGAGCTNADGNKTVYVIYTDDVDNNAVAVNTGLGASSFYLDTNAPDSVTIDTNFTGIGRYSRNNPISLLITANDTGSELYDMNFSCNGTTFASPVTYAAITTFSVKTASYGCGTGDGNKSVYMRVRDRAYNVSTANIANSFVIDTTAPSFSTLNLTITGVGKYTYQNPNTLTISGSDATAGLYDMNFSCDNATFSVPESYATSTSFNLRLGAGCTDVDGNKTVYGRLRDRAGNVGTKNSGTGASSQYLDTVFPVTSSDVNADWQSIDANVHLVCTDTGGCLSTRYRLDSDSNSVVSMGAWDTFDKNILFTLDGNWAIDFNSTDRAKNIETTNRQFILINKNPTLFDNNRLSVPNWGVIQPSTTVVIYIDVNDFSGLLGNPFFTLKTPAGVDYNISLFLIDTNRYKFEYSSTNLPGNYEIKAFYATDGLGQQTEFLPYMYFVVSGGTGGGTGEAPPGGAGGVSPEIVLPLQLNPPFFNDFFVFCPFFSASQSRIQEVYADKPINTCFSPDEQVICSVDGQKMVVSANVLDQNLFGEIKTQLLVGDNNVSFPVSIVYFNVGYFYPFGYEFLPSQNVFALLLKNDYVFKSFSGRIVGLRLWWVAILALVFFVSLAIAKIRKETKIGFFAKKVSKATAAFILLAFTVISVLLVFSGALVETKTIVFLGIAWAAIVGFVSLSWFF